PNTGMVIGRRVAPAYQPRYGTYNGMPMTPAPMMGGFGNGFSPMGGSGMGIGIGGGSMGIGGGGMGIGRGFGMWP
ncbi:MAG: hypothetical protein ACRD3W_23485, partial [Terriglobales bacterium]